MFQNNTNICCYTISLFHTHILSCRQRCPQALRAPWPLSFTGTSPVSPMASHPVGTLCWSDAPWAHQKDWKPHLLGSLHTPGMNPERKTDVSLAETYLSQGSYWPACLQTHPEDLTMTLLPLAVQQCHRVAGCEPLSRCHQVGPAGLHPRLCCVCIAVAAGLHHGVLQYRVVHTHLSIFHALSWARKSSHSWWRGREPTGVPWSQPLTAPSPKPTGCLCHTDQKAHAQQSASYELHWANSIRLVK